MNQQHQRIRSAGLVSRRVGDDAVNIEAVAPPADGSCLPNSSAAISALKSVSRCSGASAVSL